MGISNSKNEMTILQMFEWNGFLELRRLVNSSDFIVSLLYFYMKTALIFKMQLLGLTMTYLELLMGI